MNPHLVQLSLLLPDPEMRGDTPVRLIVAGAVVAVKDYDLSIADEDAGGVISATTVDDEQFVFRTFALDGFIWS